MLSSLMKSLSLGTIDRWMERSALDTEAAAAEARVKGLQLTESHREELAKLHEAAFTHGTAEGKQKYVEYVDGISGEAPASTSDEQFAEAQARARTIQAASNDDILAMHAFQRQATEGENRLPRPKSSEDVELAKWEAWKDLGDMSADEARRRYVDIVDRLAPPSDAVLVDELFRQAVERSKAMPRKPSQDDQLQLYSLFKQSQEGACTTPKPNMFDVVGKAKWNAWKKLGDMDRREAMQQYVALVDRLGAPPYETIAKASAVTEEEDDLTCDTVDMLLEHSGQPTSEAIKARRENAYKLAYGKERLAAFDGARPLEKFCSPYEILRWRAQRTPEKHAYSHLEDVEQIGATFTYAELDTRARAIAGALREHCKGGARVMLLYPQNLEFVAAFFGCLYSGTIAVPSYPPHPARLNRLLPRLLGMIDDCQPTVIATTREIKEMAQMLADQVPQLATIPLIATDEVPSSLAEGWTVPDVTRDTVAFLQYTSGSTSAPKGVMVTHFNLVYNLEIFRVAGEMTEAEVGVSWCPEFHDLGLIAGILCPVYLGFPLYLMSPELFLQKPARWVQAMSKYRGTFSGGPNFAYDLAVKKTTIAERRTLDLSPWRIAFCGAEPVKISTAKAFKEAFPSFPSTTFYPGYGLAEATLIIANKMVRMEPTHLLVKEMRDNVVIDASDEDITRGEYRSIVSQGVSWLDNDLRIVDPESLVELPHRHVGEIIVQGPTVARGYWNKNDETAAAFKVRISGKDHLGEYLRTGDLGFTLPNGEVFVCGRRKDVLIINGSNFYPQDLEATGECTHGALRRGCSAAFSIDDGPDSIVILFEIDTDRAKGIDLAALAADISRAIMDAHGIRPRTVGLIPPRTICKTSSGKIQRSGTRAAYLADEFEILASFTAGKGAAVSRSDSDRSSMKTAPTSSGNRCSLELEEADDDIVFHTPLNTPPSSPSSKRSPVPQPFAQLRTPSQLSLPSGNVITASIPSGAVASKAAKSPQRSSYSSTDVAIVGIGCRLPEVSTPDELWSAFRQGKCTAGKVPKGRWPEAATTFPHGSFLPDVSLFDCEFFGLTPEEAELIDPQHRLLLEVCQEALDDAALSASRLRGQGRVGCFIGISQQEYSHLVREAGQDRKAAELGKCATPNDKFMASGRIQSHFGFRGPARSIDTACSSSLVALHDACQALARGECKHAVVGGVNLMLTPDISAAFDQGSFLAPDGKCKTFDASANGYSRGEGACAVLLKPLDAAMADGDRIYSVVKGVAVNQDGRSNGITAPNGKAQEQCIKAALEKARVAPTQVQYVEAHGTGTALGDPIEIKALQSVYGEEHFGTGCRVGSAKTNFCHLEAAAGLLGVIKVTLALSHRALPPSLHYTSPNPHTPFVDRAVQKTYGEWPCPGSPLYAGCSSFGFGGTNAHAVLCEAPRATRGVVGAPPVGGNTAYVLPISHPTKAGLLSTRDAMVRALRSMDDSRLHSFCAAAALRREHYANRAAVTGFTREELLEKLRVLPEGSPASVKQVGFVFSGQGPQWYGMGRRLLHKYPVFHETIKVVDELLAKVHAELGARYGVPHVSVLEQFLCPEEDSMLSETFVAQPAIFALQLALANLLRSFGITPAAVVGHSLGEVAAAVVSGSVTLAEAVKLIFIRGCIMQKATGSGKMAAVQLRDDGDLEKLLAGKEDRVVVASYNAPQSVVLSGESADIDQAVSEAKALGLYVRLVKVQYAFHSPQMNPLSAELLRELEAAGNLSFPAFPSIPLYSTGKKGVRNPALDTGYWSEQICQPVHFAAALEKMAEDGITTFIELSPHPVLSESIVNTVPDSTALYCLHREQDEERSLKVNVGHLYVSGIPLHWGNVAGVPHEDCSFTKLPRTVFARKSHWVRKATTLYVDQADLNDDWDTPQ